MCLPLPVGLSSSVARSAACLTRVAWMSHWVFILCVLFLPWGQGWTQVRTHGGLRPPGPIFFFRSLIFQKKKKKKILAPPTLTFSLGPLQICKTQPASLHVKLSRPVHM